VERGGDGLLLSLDATIVKADGTPCVTGTVDLELTGRR
jgi:hypothetical protein